MTEPDELDRRLVVGLQVSPRASFRDLGRALGVSEQTAARRYRALVRAGLLRVTAVRVVETAGHSSWGFRLTCRPGSTAAVAEALAKRDDVSWLSTVAGGSELVGAVNSTSVAGREQLILRQLPKATAVLSHTAFTYLHYFRGERSGNNEGSKDWLLPTPAFDAGVRRALSATKPKPVPPASRLDEGDERLMAMLAVDGRVGVPEIARETGWSESTAARRLAALVGSRVIGLDVDVLPAAFGITMYALLLVSVQPARLGSAGEAMGELRNVPFTAAITGPAGLLVSVMAHDTDELYRVVNDEIGPVPGVTGLEILPTTSTLKQAGNLVRDGRLVPPVS